MQPTRLIALACFVALAATGAVAREQDRDAAPEAPTQSAPASPAGARYARPGMAPASPSAEDDRYRRSLRPSFPTRDDRYRSVQGRYSMPREISSDLHRAIESAQQRHGGKVLSADRLRVDGRDLYRVKLLTPTGRVRVVQMQDELPPEPTPSESPGDK